MINQETLYKLLEASTSAVSPYNVQPWRFRFENGELWIYIMRSKNFFLKLEGLSEMTLGAILENIVSCAPAFSLIATVKEIGPIKSLDSPCAKISFSKSNEKQDIRFITERFTNRNMYSKKKIPEHIKEKLISTCSPINGDIKISEDREKKYLAEIFSALETVRAHNKMMFCEALNYVRFSQKDLEKDRLRVETLRLSKGTITFLRACSKYNSLHFLFKLFGIHKKLGKRSEELFMNSGAIISFVLHSKESKGFLDVGRCMQRAMNELNKEGVSSMSVLSGLYLFDVLDENPEIFSNHEKNTILNSRWDIGNVLKFEKGEKIVYLLRAGYDPMPYTARSPRKPVESLFLQ